MQTQQKTCPHGVEVGTRRGERQSGHCRASAAKNPQVAADDEGAPVKGGQGDMQCIIWLVSLGSAW